VSGSGDKTDIEKRTGDATAVDAFLKRAAEQLPVGPRSNPRGRLVFALDATMSRQSTWDLAQGLQGKMFEIAGGLGGLAVQLVYFRGFGECRASSFVSGGKGLADLMAKIRVRGGHTQIGKVLRHVRDEARATPIGALVYVGDAMEEQHDDLCQAAGEMALLGVKAFLFQEGHDAATELTFREIARLTGGAFAAFDSRAPETLAALLTAAAAYAAGGRPALEAESKRNSAAAALLLSQMR
jgi:hypothetical protein